MSFFKKLADGIADDLGRLGLGPDKKEGKDGKRYPDRNGVGQHYPPPQHYPPQGYGYPSPQPYGGNYQSPPPAHPPPGGSYYPPPGHQPYSTPPPQPGYSSPPPQGQGPSAYAYPPQPGPRPPPPYNPPADKPPIPSGWKPCWDDHYQRWFYVEEHSGRSQWEAPGYEQSYRPPPENDNRGHDIPGASHGYGAPPAGYDTHHTPSVPGAEGQSPYGQATYGQAPDGQAPYGQAPYGQNPYGPGPYGGEHVSPQPEYEDHRGSHKEKKSHSGMLLGAAGGLAVGAVAGASSPTSS
ncbi:hypothetical protein VTH06DRAFT_5237, partial [Thermothelomyces fergusii]